MIIKTDELKNKSTYEVLIEHWDREVPKVKVHGRIDSETQWRLIHGATDYAKKIGDDSKKVEERLRNINVLTVIRR